MTSHTVLTLPAIIHGSSQWRLPLCDATVLSLACATVQETIETRAAHLSAALAVDPAFAVWAVWQATRESAQGKQTVVPQSIDALARWLSPRLLQLFDWQKTTSTVEVSAEQHGRFAALVAESVAAAHEAARSLGSNDLASEPIYLVQLTGQWQQWLAAQTGEATLADPPIVWPWDSPPISTVTASEARAAADEAWRRWLSEIPTAHLFLPLLTAQMRRLSELESSFERRLQSAKLDSLKEFAYGAGHELNNPLANIASRAQTLLKEEKHPERRRRLAAINTQAFRAHEMLADMMLFARPPQPVWQQVDLVPLVDEVLAGLADLAAQQQTALHAPTRCEPLHVKADGVQLRIALRTLCINALEALNHGGNITVEICRSEEAAATTADLAELMQNNFAQNDLAQIAVTDDGPGIAAEIRDKIFDPFFSGREAGRGLGFGLSKCWRIVTLHGGRVDVHSAPGQGATLTISLPLATGPMALVNP
jgi:signal transduction histidine kinase